ncbi:MAG: hypothetical protein ABF868_09360 [Sporolactobacillus sp.]
MGKKLDNEGVLVSRKGRRAVILTRKGDFRSVRLNRRAQISVGELVGSRHLVEESGVLHHTALFFAICLSVLCLGSLAESSYPIEQAPAAYIGFDTGSVFETGHRSTTHVLSVNALTDSLLLTEKVQHLSLEQFAARLINHVGNDVRNRQLPVCLISAAFYNRLTAVEKRRLLAGIKHDWRQYALPVSMDTSLHAAWQNEATVGVRAAIVTRTLNIPNVLGRLIDGQTFVEKVHHLRAFMVARSLRNATSDQILLFSLPTSGSGSWRLIPGDVAGSLSITDHEGL